MKTAIVFYSTHGCAEKAAVHLNKVLTEADCSLFDLKDKPIIPLSDYDTIIIGGSIHAGKIQRQVSNFYKMHQSILLQKKLGLYLCCMFDGDKAQEQFSTAYPVNLRRHAKANGLFGGEFDFGKMNFFEKAIVKKVAGIESSVSNIDYAKIEEFASEIMTP